MGTRECTAFTAPAPTPAPAPVCPARLCAAGTSGPCRLATARCMGYFPGTALCPVGTWACGVSRVASPTPTPTVVALAPAATAVVAVAGWGDDAPYTVSAASEECGAVTVGVGGEPCAGAVGPGVQDAVCLPVTVTLLLAVPLQGAARALEPGSAGACLRLRAGVRAHALNTRAREFTHI